MLTRLTIGVMLLVTLSSCNPPTIKEPVEFFAISHTYSEAGKGFKNLNIVSEVSTIGEWVGDIEFIPLEMTPTNMMCFSMETWLKKIKPKLKEGGQYYQDHKK